MSTHKSLLKSAGVVSFATFISRILGFARDVVIARLFGVYVYAQAFVIAFKIPNLLRDFIGEGASNAAFVPVFSEYALKHSKKDFWELANVVLNLLLVILAGITVLGIIFSPLIVRLIAPGFSMDPEKLAVTIRLTRIIFPYILLVGLAAYAMALLNSLRHFSVPAFAPCLLNISIIAFALVFGNGIAGIASGILTGGLLQLAVQVPVLYKKGFRLALFRRFRHPEAKVIGKLMLPRFFSSCIYQLNNFVDSIFGSLAPLVGEGGVAGLYFAYHLILFPLGIFSSALTQVILPTFSAQALEDSHDKLKLTLSFGLRATAFVILPASFAFMALSFPIVSTIFAGGKFDFYASHLTANVLFFYSIGLFAYGGTRILQSCFFALKDTATPAKISAVALAVNITLNSILIFPMKLSGIALATSISGIISFMLLFAVLRNRLKRLQTRRLAVSFLRILAASICMGLLCFFLARVNIIPTATALLRFVSLSVIISIGLISYVLFCFLFGVQEMRQLWDWVVRKHGLSLKNSVS